MRKFPFVKRTIVSVLCVALLLTGNLSTMATEVGEMVTESTETVETTETMVEETTEVVETETTDKNDKTSGSYSLSSTPANDESTSDVPTTFTANEASNLVCTFTWKYEYWYWGDKTNYYYANVYAVDTSGNEIAISGKNVSVYEMSNTQNLNVGVANDGSASENVDYFEILAERLNLEGYKYRKTCVDRYQGEESAGASVKNISFNRAWDASRDDYVWHYVDSSTENWTRWKTKGDNAGTVNVYMVFEPKATHTITYKEDWQTELGTETVYEGNTITLPSAEEYATDSNVVVEWKEDATQTIYKPGDQYTVNGDAAFSAVWGSKVSFVDEDGTTELADPAYVSMWGSTILPGKTDVPEKEGYELSGWEDSEKTIWAPATTYYNVTKNETLKAVWKNKCTITFDAGKGSFVENANFETVQTKLEGESLYLPGSYVVTRTGYTFDGWSDGTVTYKAGEKYDVKGNVIFTAVWKNNSNVIETVDTTSKGVTITLFDYKANAAGNGSEEVGKVGINSGSGINSGHKLKFMNNASGNTPLANCYTDGSGVRKNIVATTLGSDGFPKLSGNTSVWGSNYTESLSYLFDESDIANAKKVYPNANYLFTLDSEGYYSYDSDQNFATIADEEGNDFIVYADKGSGFFPFTAKANDLSSGCNNTDGDVLGSNKINHYFGMTIETEFLQPAAGKINGEDMIFEFSGDDDVWVFIDGILALDLGGIHGAASGSINFATGDVKIGNSIDTTLSALGIKLEDYSVHTMKFFYLERGNQESNCKIKFNLQTVPKGSLSVSKNAIDVAEGDTSDYEFVLKDSTNGVGVKNASYTIGTSSTVYSTDENGVFTLKNGQSAVFANLESGDYTVTETEVKNSNNAYKLSDFSTRVSVNGGELTTITAASEKPRMATVTVSDAHTSSVDFRNLLIKEEVNETNSVLSKVIRHDDVDNDYDLTLSFKGPKQELTKTEYEDITTITKAKVDIVLVMDVSGSMDGDNLSNSKNAVSNMVGAIKAKEQTVDARWKLVTFSSGANIVTSDWGNSDTLLSNVKSINNPTGGTNYQDGLVKAQTAVSTNAREDATQIVIFITDGAPTYHLCSKHNNCYYYGDDYWRQNSLCNHYDKLSNAGNIYCGGSNETYRADYEGSIMGAQALSCDTFYAVGIGLQDDVYRLNGKSLNGIDVLTNVANAVNATTKSAVNKKPSELGSLFSNIAGEIITESESHITKTYKYASKVTLTDTLSEYVDIVENSDVVISVKNAEGNEVGTCTSGKPGASDASYTFKDGESDVTLTASYSNKVVTLNFPEDYELDEDYTYAVTFTVKASETAYNEYATDGYTNVGAANTDAEGNETSSGKQGFNSNTEAKVTYSFDGEEKTENFDHPVIQVDAAKLILVKHNEKREPLSGVTFTLYKDTDTTGVAKTTSENGRLDFGYLTSGSYRLVETAAPEKYALLDKESQALTFTVSKGVITFDEVDAHWKLPTEAETTSITAGEGESAIVNTAENAYSVTVYNDLARIYEWNIYKISASSTSDNMIYLEGAEFTLSSDDHTYYGKSESDGKITWYSDDEYTTVVEEVAAGTYTLKETLAPTGYTVNEDWTFVIGLDNNISGFDQSNASYDEATKTYTIYYEDEALYSLPATGGTGIFAYMFGGMFLMMAGALYIFMSRRKAYRV